MNTKEIARYSQGFGVVTTSLSGVSEGSKRICSLSDFGKSVEEVDANGILIADAFNVANESGLAPSELLAQRNELLGALKRVDYLYHTEKRIEEYLTPYKEVWMEVEALLTKIKTKP